MTVKKEKDVFKFNLTDDTKSYVHYLNEKIQDIYSMYENRSVSVDQFKEYIRRIISDAADTQAKRKFLLTLTSQRTKDNVVQFVQNALFRGQGLEVI